MSPAAPRVATPADAALVTRVLVDAFADDPMWGAWAFPSACDRRAHREAVFGLFVDGALRYPTTWIAEDDSAVAMWIPPGGNGLSPEQEIALEAELTTRLGMQQAARIFQAFDLFDAMEPSEPHYYLSLLGTDPAYAGRGRGRQLLEDTLRVVDSERAAAYLDCADELVPFYSGLGFEVVGSVVLPDGPRSNGMVRSSKTALHVRQRPSSI